MQITTSVLCQRLFRSNISRISSISKYSTQRNDTEERKTAISNGPSLEDFVSGDVNENDKWSNYSGELVKQKGMKR